MLINNNSIQMMPTPPPSHVACVSSSGSQPAGPNDLLGNGQSLNGWPAGQSMTGNAGMSWAVNSQANTSVFGPSSTGLVTMHNNVNGLISGAAPMMTPTMTQQMTPQMAPQAGFATAPGAFPQPGGFSVNPFWDNPSNSPMAPTAYTQVSFSSSAQLQQQQQRFAPPQMYPQQFSQYQRPDMPQNGFPGSHMMRPMGNMNMPRPNQVSQQFAQQQQLQQQMAGMKIDPNTGGFSSLANSTISFLD